LNLDWQQLSYASLVICAVDWRAFRRPTLSAFRRSIDTRAMGAASVRLDMADAATIELLVEELSDPDETRVLYAIEMLETLDERNLITPLLLHHESPRVRARALAALETARVFVSSRWLPAVERMLKDEDADVRAAAVQRRPDKDAST
jgi:HEAT repeat protein